MRIRLQEGAGGSRGAVRFDTANGILAIIPVEVKNRTALGAMFVYGLHAPLTEADPEICAVVVTNEDTTFCAGANR